MRPSLIRSVLLLTCAVLPLLAQETARPPVVEKDNQFLITKWTTEDGLPQNTVTSITQTDDGFIWLGTFGGLARFDGIKFTVFNSANTPVLRSNRILSLYEDSRGVLWIGSEEGNIFRMADGRFEEFAASAAVSRENIGAFIDDDSGHFYVATKSGVERYTRGANGEIDPRTRKLVATDESGRLVKDREGRIWFKEPGRYRVITERGIVTPESLGIEMPKYPNRLLFLKGGDMYAAGSDSLGIIENGRYFPLMDLDVNVHQAIYDFKFWDGEAWFQQADKVYEITKDRIVTHSLAPFTDTGSRALFFDNEGNLWVGTNRDGLLRLTRKVITSISDISGFTVDNTYAVIEDNERNVWVAANDLYKVSGGTVTKYKAERRPDGIPTMKSLAVDRSGRLWVGAYPGLFVFGNGRLVPVAGFEDTDINAMFFDPEDTLWIGGDTGLYSFRSGEIRNYTVRDGLADDRVRSIAQTRDGTLWIGTVRGVSRFRNGRFKNLTVADGLSNDHVRDVLETSDGTIWLATYGGGIDRVKDGKIATITREDGLQDDFVSRILVDDFDRFWVLGNRGIFAALREDFERVADGTESVLIGATYGSSDGMISSEGSGAHQPAGYKTSDGRLWFPMIADVAIIDPQKLAGSPPKVYIERAFVRSRNAAENRPDLHQGNGTSVKIPNGVRNLEIEYTGLSFTKPEQIRFFYKLEGLDDEWIDAGTRRTAFFPYLPSGNYTFLVKAVSAQGVWSEQEAKIQIEVEKAIWQTLWFRILVIALTLIAAYLLYRNSVSRLRKRQLEQERFAKRLLSAHESERERISKELHDGLGQHLLVIKNWAALGLEGSSGEEEMREQLGAISASASEALDETRSIVDNLRPQNLRRFGLTEAISNMVSQVQSASGVVFETDLENIDDIFPEETEIGIYRIVQECLNNVVKHSESPRGLVGIARSDGSIEILVRDYGKGFDANADHKGFGLKNMAQRLRLLGGDMKVTSEEGEGTTISIKVKLKSD